MCDEDGQDRWPNDRTQAAITQQCTLARIQNWSRHGGNCPTPAEKSLTLALTGGVVVELESWVGGLKCFLGDFEKRCVDGARRLHYQLRFGVGPTGYQYHLSAGSDPCPVVEGFGVGGNSYNVILTDSTTCEVIRLGLSVMRAAVQRRVYCIPQVTTRGVRWPWPWPWPVAVRD